MNDKSLSFRPTYGYSKGRGDSSGDTVEVPPRASAGFGNKDLIRTIKQSVLSDVSCVLARANGADIDPTRAFGAARNVCEILFAHPMHPHSEIPKLFWDTPLGRAVGVCCGGSANGDLIPVPTHEAGIQTTLCLPYAVSEKLRQEAERRNKTVADLIAERLTD